MILDGGLSNALVARGHDLSDELWTASLLRDAPAALRGAAIASGGSSQDLHKRASNLRDDLQMVMEFERTRL